VWDDFSAAAVDMSKSLTGRAQQGCAAPPMGTRSIYSSYLANQWGPTANFFKGGVLLRNGKIVMIPYNSPHVLVLGADLTTHATVSVTTGNSKWSGAAMASNGEVFAAPASASSILRISAAGTGVSYISVPDGVTGSNKYCGAVTSASGNVVLIPYAVSSVTVVTAQGTTRVFGTMSSFEDAWCGGVLTASKLIYAMPSIKSRPVLVINEEQSFVRVLETLQQYWYGGTLGADGFVYSMAQNGQGLKLNPNDEIVTMLDTSTPGCVGTIQGLDGLVYCMGNDGSNPALFAYNPASGTLQSVGVTSLTGVNTYHGAVMSNDGRLVFVPDDSQHVLIVRPRVEAQWVNPSFGMSPFVNHF
jgi:hypothetical protein